MSEPDEMREIREMYSRYIIDPLNFVKIKSTGKGGYADVWLVSYKSDSEKKAALKQLFSDISSKQIRHFAREIQTMAEVDHPFFVKMLGFSPTKPLSLLSEYIPNGSLYKFIRSDPKGEKLTNTKRTLIAMGIANAMTSLHKAGIIHRDLKSMNILLDEDLLPRLCDFGIARFNNPGETNTMRLGTPHWMAPESLDGEEGYSYPVDVYAFGMVMYELLTFKIPWAGMDPIAVTRAVVFEKRRPKLPPLAPKSLKDLIQRCWETEPEKRPTFSEIYRLFSSGQVFFNNTDHEEVRKLDQKLSEFNASLKIKEAGTNVQEKKYQRSKTRNRRISDISFDTSDENDDKTSTIIVKDSLNDSSDADYKLPCIIDEESSPLKFSSSHYENVTKKSRRNSSFKHLEDNSFGEFEIKKQNSEIICLDNDTNESFSEEILSDLKNSNFRAELKRVVNNIDKHNVRELFKIIQNHFSEKTSDDDFIYILNLLRSIIDKPYVYTQFSQRNLQYKLPIYREKLFRSVLDFLYVAFSSAPSIFQNNFEKEFMYILQRDPESALVLLQLTAKKFNELSNPWTLLDFLYNEDEYFFNSTAVSEFISTVFYLCKKYNDFRKYRLEPAIELYICALRVKDKSAVNIAYNALHHCDVNPSLLDLDILKEHLADEELCPKVVKLLLRTKIKYTESLLEAIIESASYCNLSCALLANITDEFTYAEYMSKSTDWTDQKLPTLLDTFRIFLNVFSHPELRKNLSSSPAVYHLLKSICMQNNAYIVSYMYNIIVRLPQDKKVVKRLSKFAVLDTIIQNTLKFNDENALYSMLRIIKFCALITYTQEYLLVSENLKSILKSYGKSHLLVVKLISILSRFKECAEKLNDPKLERYFRDKLKDNNECREFRELYLKNIERLKNL